MPESADRFPKHLEPMLATLSEMPSNASAWGFEYKWDGIRALAYFDGRRLVLESRNLIDITNQYPEFAGLGKTLGRKAILDGEIVALDGKGNPSFKMLQSRMHLTRGIEAAAEKVTAYYFVFDILYIESEDVMGKTYIERRKILEGLDIKHKYVHVPAYHVGQGKRMLEAAREKGIEGVMAKALDSLYQPGRRTPEWRKIKIEHGQEFVIGGWIPERQNAGRVGAILVGYYDGSKLEFSGKVGTGFSDETHTILIKAFKPLARVSNPFASEINMKGVNWLSPKLVAEIQYRRWPDGGMIQQASFKGLRSDKLAHDIIHEKKVEV
jgi:bifunctional non-homologous end joining protein LigD